MPRTQGWGGRRGFQKSQALLSSQTIHAVLPLAWMPARGHIGWTVQAAALLLVCWFRKAKGSRWGMCSTPVGEGWGLTTLPHDSFSTMRTHEAQVLCTCSFSIFNSHSFHKGCVKQEACSHIRKEGADVHRAQVICIRSQSLFGLKAGYMTPKCKTSYLSENVGGQNGTVGKAQTLGSHRPGFK